jgi:hypothetical protein
MAIKADSDGVTFSSGRTMYANQGILGLSPDLELYEGYDGGVWVFDENGNWALGPEEPPTRVDLVELADMMMVRWQQFKWRVMMDQVVQLLIPGVKGEHRDLRVFYDWRDEEIKLEMAGQQYNLVSRKEVMRDNEWKRDLTRRVRVILRKSGVGAVE